MQSTQLFQPAYATMFSGCTQAERIGLVTVDAAIIVDMSAPDEAADIEVRVHVYSDDHSDFDISNVRGHIHVGDAVIDMDVDLASGYDRFGIERASLDHAPEEVTLRNSSVLNSQLRALGEEESLLFTIYHQELDRDSAGEGSVRELIRACN